MFEIEEGIWVGAGVLLLGVVGYKILQKGEFPSLKGLSKPFKGISRKVSDVMEAATESFREGYSNA